MARSKQIPIPVGDAVELSVEGPSDNTYGDEPRTLRLFNSGTVVVELGGEDLDETNGFRGLIVGGTFDVDLAEEKLYARVDGVTAGEIDVLVVH